MARLSSDDVRGLKDRPPDIEGTLGVSREAEMRGPRRTTPVAVAVSRHAEGVWSTACGYVAGTVSIDVDKAGGWRKVEATTQ